jgi:cytochrome c-type biogenesis protein CcmE
MEVEIPQNKRVKLGGMVEKNSVVRDGAKITFNITDYQKTISVSYNGVVPDLFKEGSGIVAYGIIINNKLVAENIFAKHDENYMPPSIEISS